MVNPILQLINLVLNMVSLALIVWIIIGWLIAFNILNRYQPLVYRVNDALTRFFDPMLRKIRRFVPPLGTIDISPIVLWLILYFVQSSINYIYFKYLA